MGGTAERSDGLTRVIKVITIAIMSTINVIIIVLSLTFLITATITILSQTITT